MSQARRRKGPRQRKGLRQRRLRHIKLMADYTAFPLWGIRDEGRWGGGMLWPDALPLSDALVEQLEAWAAVYDSLMDTDFEWPSKQAEIEFVAEGRRLLTRLREELGSGYEVTYFNELTGELER